jgi:hypothetical protein
MSTTAHLARGLLVWAILVASPAVAAAQSTATDPQPSTAESQPVTQPQPQPTAVVTVPKLSKSYIGDAKESYQLFVFGDSLAAGLFAGMSRMAEGDLRLVIDGRFKDDSGLARPEFYDWAVALPKIHERREMAVAVILLGSNDGQDIRTISGPIPFATPEWASVYAQRVDTIIDLLKSRGIAIYWVELPPMGPVALEGETNYIATVQRDRALRQHVKYVETRRVFSDVNGNYTDQGADASGKVTRLRSRDGIHFLKSGNDRLAMLLLDAIRRDIAVADGKVVRGFVSPHLDDPVRPAPEKIIRPMPVFGQMPGAKEETSLTYVVGDPQWASAVLAVSGRGGHAKSDLIGTPELVISALRSRVEADTNAGRLLFEGRWPRARKGRYDDFSWPKAQ